MSFFAGDYLRVLTPKTVDGVVPLLIDGEQQYSESHMPLTAKKFLERKNAKRQNHLKHIIEVVETGIPEKKKEGPKPKKVVKPNTE